MARPLRIEYRGALYHVTSRGDRQEEIFDDDQDRRAFLNVLSEVLRGFAGATTEEGHLFQSRYKAIIVERGSYFLA